MIRLKNYRLLLIAALLSALVGLIYRELTRTREPIVDGKPLDFWLDQYRDCITGGGEDRVSKQAKAEEAIRHLGTNAIPQLLAMLRERDVGLGDKLLELLQKQSLIRIRYKPAWVRNNEAADGFEILGADAREAVPALIEIYERPQSPSSQVSAAAALAGIGPAASAAVPVLLRGTTNSDHSVRLFAIATLGPIHSTPTIVVPALTRCLNDPFVDVRCLAARSLGHYGPDARQAVPELEQLLNAKERVMRSEAALALKQIDPGRK
jgi:HEAT repeat protein